MQHLGIERFEFGNIETGRGASEAGEVDAVDQRRDTFDRLDRITGAKTGEQCHHRQRLDAIGAQGVAIEAAEAFREFALAAD